MYVDTGLTNGENYYYTAFSYDLGGNYSGGKTSNGMPQDHSIHNFMLMPLHETVTEYWPSDAGADGYHIYYTDDGSEPGPEKGIMTEVVGGGVT